jgi:cytochrome c
MKGIWALLAMLVASLGLNAFAAADRGTTAEAEAMVKKAVAYYEKNGREKALAEFQRTPGSFVDRDLYVTVYSMDGTCLSHINSKMVGKNFMEARDGDGVHFLRDRIEAAKTKESGWQDYKYFNPVSKRIEPKTMYWQKADGVVFGAGAYKP